MVHNHVLDNRVICSNAQLRSTKFVVYLNFNKVTAAQGEEDSNL